MITPKDIETKVFSSSLKGYKREEVDQFLDELMVEVQSLIKENETLKSNIQDLRKEVENRKESETSIMRTLEQAKSLMSDISASAEKRAEAIVRNAQSEAARMLADARDSVSAMNAEGERIRGRVADFKDRYRMMLRDELRKIESGSDDFFLEHGEDFYPASMDDGSMQDGGDAVTPAMQEFFGGNAPSQPQSAVEAELAEMFGESVLTEAPPENGGGASTDAEMLFREIAAESAGSAGGMGDTLHGVSSDAFKSEVVDDMAKTIVMDQQEMARLSKE